MKTYILRMHTAEIRFKDRKNIKTGCALEDQEPIEIKRFDTMEQAMDFASDKKYMPTCAFAGSAVKFFLVTEYMIEECEVDEDGEWVSGGDFDSAFLFKFDEDRGDIVITNEEQVSKSKELKTERIQIKIEPSVKEFAATQAAKEGRTMSNWIIELIKKEMNKNS